MKTKIIILLVFIGLFLFAFNTFAYYTTPAGDGDPPYIGDTMTFYFEQSDIDGCPAGQIKFNVWYGIWSPPDQIQAFESGYTTSSVSYSTTTIEGYYSAESYCSNPPAWINPLADTIYHISEYPPVCDSEHLYLCITQSTCLTYNGYWYNETCNVWPPYIETNENFVAGIISYMRGWIGSGISPLLAVFIGLPFAFVVLKKVINLMPKK